MKFSLDKLIRFLPLFCNCQIQRPDSVQFLCFQAHISAGWRLETQLHSMLLLPHSELFLISILQGPRRDDRLLLRRRVYGAVALHWTLFDRCLRIRCHGNVFIESLHSNERLFWLCYSGFQASCDNIVIWNTALYNFQCKIVCTMTVNLPRYKTNNIEYVNFILPFFNDKIKYY
jgi:hypothetical protein